MRAEAPWREHVAVQRPQDDQFVVAEAGVDHASFVGEEQVGSVIADFFVQFVRQIHL